MNALIRTRGNLDGNDIRFRYRFRRLTAGALLAVSALFLSACGGAGEAPLATMKPLQPGEYGLSRECGACHRDIYAGWASSMHAKAGQDIRFQRAFEEAAAMDQARAETLCYSCHSPAHVYGATNITTAQSIEEGVGCDFCHSMVALDFKHRDRPYAIEFGPVKRGPIPDGDSMAHGVAYSDLHEDSTMCVGCHEFATESNVPILSTFSEWQASSYAREGVNCQHCHMPYALADVVDPRVKRVGNQAVNLHQMPGGHSRQMMFKALRMRFLSLAREKGRLQVALELTNSGTGHSVPTGMPTRKVVLTVEVTTSGGQQQKQEVVYERVMADADGKVLLRDSDLLMKAAAVVSDNRLKAGETRTERLDFPDFPGENLMVQARLTYLYSPHADVETEIRFDFHSEDKHLVAQFRRQP